MKASGPPLHLLLLRKGAAAELTSVVYRAAFQDVRAQAAIARTEQGEAMVSLEFAGGIALSDADDPGAMRFTVRGLPPIGLTMRPWARIVEGRMFEPGRREVLAGSAIAELYPHTRLGRTLSFARGEWRLVGILDCGRAACGSEILGGLNRAASGYERMNGMSGILVRATDDVALEALRRRFESDPRLNTQAKNEREYYAGQMAAAAPVQAMAAVVALPLATGAGFAALNTT